MKSSLVRAAALSLLADKAAKGGGGRTRGRPAARKKAGAAKKAGAKKAGARKKAAARKKE